MALRWHVFHATAILFVIKVSCDEVPAVSTSFFGLQGDTNLGHSGYVHLSTDEKKPDFELSSCQTLDVNESTCHFAHKVPKTEATLMVMRAWVAVTIRDNILGLLGYLLHHTDDVFTEDTYSSLSVVYEEVRRNNIKTMDMIPRLTKIAKVNQITRIMDVFRIMQGVLPAYCRSAVDEILRAIPKQKDKLRSILNGTTDDRSIDIFTDIGLQIVPFLRSKSTRRSHDKSLDAEMGREFAIFFSAIQESKIILTQPVLAVLMLNMRFGELSPGDSEDFRFLTDTLRDSKIPDWSPGIIGAVNVKCPFVLVQMMMKTIANRSQIDSIIKDIVTRLHSQLQKVSKSQRSTTMVPLFGRAELNVSLLLEILDDEVKIPQVQTLRQMINDGTVSLSYALKGFVRYYYKTPRDLLLAFIRRIQNRVAMNSEATAAVEQIVSHLVSRDANSITVENAVAHNETKSKRSIKILRYDTRPLLPHLGELNFHASTGKQCSHGSNCFTTIFTKLTKLEKIVTSSCSDLPKISLASWIGDLNGSAVNVSVPNLLRNISTILTIFTSDSEIGRSIDDIRNRAVPQNLNQPINHTHTDPTDDVKLVEGITGGKVNSVNSLVETRRDLLIRILRDMLSIRKVRARRFVYYEVIRVYCVLIRGVGREKSRELRLDEPTMSNVTEVLGESVSEPLRDIIRKLNSPIGTSYVRTEDYKTNRQFLIDLLKRLLLVDVVKLDVALFNEVVLLLGSIQSLPVKFAEMLPLAHPGFVHDYLASPAVYQRLGEDFDIGRYGTRGQLIKAVLEKLLATADVRQNETLAQALAVQISGVVCSGHGGEPVGEIVEGVAADQVNVLRVIQYGLDREKLTGDVQEAFANVWNWYGGSFDLVGLIRGMNISLYDTRGDYLAGLLDSIEGKIVMDFNGAKRDINLMRSVVMKTGTGAEPVDYL